MSAYNVIFCVYPNQTNPNEITRIIDICPTKINIIGDTKINSNGYSRIVKINGWFLESKEIISSNDFKYHLDYILDKLDNKQHKLNTIKKINGLKMCVICSCHYSKNHSSLKILNEQLLKLSKLNIEFNFDVYFDDFLDIFER